MNYIDNAVMVVSFKKTENLKFLIPSQTEAETLGKPHNVAYVNEGDSVVIYSRKYGFLDSYLALEKQIKENQSHTINSPTFSNFQITWVKKEYFDTIIQDFATLSEANFLQAKQEKCSPWLICKYVEEVYKYSILIENNKRI